MRRALGAKMKFDFLDGSIVMPTDPFDPSFSFVPGTFATC